VRGDAADYKAFPDIRFTNNATSNIRRTKYEPAVKSILILILPVLLFFVYGIVSFVKAAVLSSACKDGT
jgi:hypothetical protein